MTYEIAISPSFEKDTKALLKKDPVLSDRIQRAVVSILNNPECGKPLRNVMKGHRRVHVGHFVLIYNVDDTNNTITLLRFNHHDKAYK
ncbi:type II toxin-antitoxin system RelE family toxin [Methanolobus psychrotolerans]|uniref:type II toxin-antitoxin system RelE family toxin n=1 Tax=Methanolobus psychrotolerans TaxID=1874706 RepID=UPI000B91CEBE|nr:type II toxin-antitoxin system RelE/ParE family toxin [Methanolobus psychrotolerans]